MLQINSLLVSAWIHKRLHKMQNKYSQLFHYLISPSHNEQWNNTLRQLLNIGYAPGITRRTIDLNNALAASTCMSSGRPGLVGLCHTSPNRTKPHKRTKHTKRTPGLCVARATYWPYVTKYDSHITEQLQFPPADKQVFDLLATFHISKRSRMD